MSEEIAFNSWLKQRRKELSITQEELADTLGVSWITLRKLEAGDRRPSGQLAVLLADYLHIPTDEHQAFVAFARTGKLAVGDVSPSAPWRNTFHRPTNLPSLLTPLIGRDQDVSSVKAHLLNPKTRLLTLTGAPGIGKTRLALQSALEMLEDFQDGIFFVDLAPIADPEMVLQAIARTLGLKETSQQPFTSLLRDYLRQKQTLLLLDNFEQILDASTEVVRLMEACPLLKVLITSREALQVRGERRFFVPPLAVPDLKQLPGLEELAQYPSVELFIERAQTVAPDFTLTDTNAQDVAAVCVGLEGLPLAIELAASRANRLSPSEMRVALTSRLKLLKSETRYLPLRQRTLRGAIQWSYNLLTPEAQSLLRSLGVFVGGFSAEVVHVMRSEGGGGNKENDEASSTLDTLYSLVDQNLVRQDGLLSVAGTRTTTEPDAATARFGMWEAIREFALEELRVHGERASADRSHALYCARLAAAAAPRLMGTDQKIWLERLEEEHDNLRVALRWAIEMGNSHKGLTNERNGRPHSEVVEAAETGLHLAVDLHEFWNTRGYFIEAREMLNGLLPICEKLGCSRELRLKALNGLGRLERTQGDFVAARTTLEQALTLGRELADKQSIADTLNHLGAVEMGHANYAHARTLYEESLAIRRELGDKHGIAQSLNNLGLATHADFDITAAHAYHSESLAIRRDLGDKRGVSQSLNHLGFMAYDATDYVSARTLHEQSLAICLELGDRQGIAFAYNNLGLSSMMQNDMEAAIAYHEQSLAIRRELGSNLQSAYSLINIGVAIFGLRDFGEAGKRYSESLALSREHDYKYGIAYALYHLGNVSYMQDHFSEARELYTEALELSRAPELQSTGPAIWCLFGLGGLAAESKHAYQAATIIGAASSYIETHSMEKDPEDQIVIGRGISSARAQSDEREFEQAWAKGQAMTLEEAINYAMQDRRGQPKE